MILKSYVQYRVSSSVDPVDSTVHVDNVTISGDGSSGSPLQIKTGYLGTAALEDSTAFDEAGAAASVESNLNQSIATLANDIDTLESYVSDQVTRIDDLETDKQDTLVSGTNIKTINGESILGSGNVVITNSGLDINAFNLTGF